MKAKKILVFSLAVIMFSVLSYAGVFIEAKGSYFQPADQSFKDIYGNGMIYGGEIGITVGKLISIWAGGHYFTKTGKLTYTEEETKIQITPIYGGIKLRLSGTSLSPYIGFAVGYFLYKEENPIDIVEKKDIGYIAQVGCIFKISGPLFLDIKGSYSYCKVKPEDIEANIGGLQGGIGLGFEF